MMHFPILPPGKTIGLVGGGQLGRMTALAAAPLGYRCHVFCQDRNEPAAQVAAGVTLGEFEDLAALAAFAETVDVITYEWENLPAESMRFLAAAKPMRPSPEILAITQDRIREKEFCQKLGIETAPFAAINGPRDLSSGLERLGQPAILKTTRLGYDGKGQAKINHEGEAAAAYQAMAGAPAILEGYVDFAAELSIIIARGQDGQTACFPVSQNEHRDHILFETTAPAPVPPAIAEAAEKIAHQLAEGLGLVGLLCVELFLTRDQKLLVNELAPRPHNSGHWTIEACPASQFEQLVRAITGLPLGDPLPHHRAVMRNLIGDAVDLWKDLIADKTAHLHLYGKNKTRFGRKMGHVTRLFEPLPKPGIQK